MNTIPPLPAKNNTKSNIMPSSEKQKQVGNKKSEQIKPKTFYFENIGIQNITDEDEEDGDYDEIPIEPFENSSESEEDESLEQAVRNMHEKGYLSMDKLSKSNKTEEPIAELVKNPEVIDDFIRNFLSAKGLAKTLESFQNEWYGYVQSDKFAAEDIKLVPTVYQQNQELSLSVNILRTDVKKYKEIAQKARSTYDKLRKERDFHRMHHKRVVQEKARLLSDLKTLKKNYGEYEPALKQLQSKYEIAMKEKMMAKIERDKLLLKVRELEERVKFVEKEEKEPVKTPTENHQSKRDKKEVNDLNPYQNSTLPIAKIDKLASIAQIQAHALTISSIKFHPKKPIIATVSDDKNWKLWSFPTGELIMSGQGHKDWISDCDFHPKGNHMATTSADSTVKLWDFGKGIATTTFTDHTHCVWSCEFNHTGSDIITGSMDNTARLWDLKRGHSESVNHVGYQPYSSIIYTCSSDKTVSFWDSRTGICNQTLFGHKNTINHGAYSLNGRNFATCDANGVIIFWDLRMTRELYNIDTRCGAINKICFDPSGTILGAAAANGTVKLISHSEKQRVVDLATQDESIHAICFDKTGEYLVTCGNDGSFRIFQ